MSKGNNHGFVPLGHTTREAPAASHEKHHDAGPEKKPDMKGAFSSKGGHMGHTGLKHAVEELHEQHPHHHSVGGIHGTKDHVRHKRG